MSVTHEKRRARAAERAFSDRAENLRYEKSTWHAKLPLNDSFAEFGRQIVAGMFSGYKIPAKEAEALQFLANGSVANRFGKVVAIERDKLAEFQVQVMDSLIEGGWIVQELGSEESQKATRYMSTRQLLNSVKPFKNITDIIDIQVDWNAKTRDPHELERQPVVLRRGDVAVPFTITPAVKALGERIKAINSRNFDFGFKFRLSGDGDWEPANVQTRAIFNGDFDRGGRLYASTDAGYTSLPTNVRRSMLISGESMAELDFSGHGPRMIYHASGITVKRRDIYQPKKVLPKLRDPQNKYLLKREGLPPKSLKAALRQFIKLATNIALNCQTHAEATKAIANELRQPEFRDVKRAISIVPITIETVLKGILEVHEPIREHFFTDATMRFQASHEVPLLLDILEAIQATGRPALGLHDGIICRSSDRKFVKKVMCDTYRERFGHDPVIKLDFLG